MPGPLIDRRAALLYLFAEPTAWGDGRPVDRRAVARHRTEIATFAELVAGDEVTFLSLAWSDLLSAWANADNAGLRRHAEAVRISFVV